MTWRAPSISPYLADLMGDASTPDTIASHFGQVCVGSASPVGTDG